MLQQQSPTIRITHWLTALSVGALFISGIAILMVHPRFYWGETGGYGGPSLFDMPFPKRGGSSGWGRYLHFLSAWIAVITGGVYYLHLIRNYSRPTYNPLQRRTYLVVVFLLAPLFVVTGLAMSPAITSVVPMSASIFGGQQSARTIHFGAAVCLAVFVAGHTVMVLKTKAWRNR